MCAATVPLLFTPLHIPAPVGAGLVLRNRIVIPPMCMFSASNGCMTAFHRMHVGSMCTAGVGLVIVEATAITPEGRITPQCCGIWDDTTAQSMKSVLDEVRTYSDGVPIAIQLIHAGRKASYYRPFHAAGSGQIAPGHADGGWETVGPSAIAHSDGDVPPREMTQRDIREAIDAFAAAARRADEAGFDAVELHYAHGYLCHQFLSPWSNARTDEYGGSLENRMRMPLEVFQAVRAAVSPTKPVWVRLSATDWTTEAGLEKGWDIGQSIELCKRLKGLGCDVVHVSSGGSTPKQVIAPTAGYQLPFSRAIREQAGMLTIGVGLITEPVGAEAALATGSADAVAVGRQYLYNPHWPYEAARKLGARLPYALGQYWRCEPVPRRGLFDQV